MANKIAAALLLFYLFHIPARAELLKLSRLEKPMPVFTLNLDIFNGAMSAVADSRTEDQAEPPAQAAQAQKTIAEEIFQSIIYEGFITKNSKKSALLNVSGEYFMVGEQEQILEKIRVLKISKDVVTIEYENQSYEIRIKGDDNG